ncbi:CIC11C00000001017 [Sungouiella intermedia]|uniref:CIC11C00000001017 n=1 Tax=Sungouiella intermedia TaxID=45354 RepID=A0A1L0C3T3_9ASCO|nr:CIC11C00000001017 [[Candida] intermedia]
MVLFIILVIAIAIVAYYYYPPNPQIQAPVGTSQIVPEVEPVDPSFKWHEAEPYKLRPFVGKKNFRPSMSVHNISNKREDLFLIEKTYLEITNHRRQVAKDYSDKIIHCNPNTRSVEAVREFYDMTIKFLCERYPQYFKIDEEKNSVFNLINNDTLPLTSVQEDPRTLITILTGNIEEDFLILLKDDPKDHSQEYILRASLTGTPAGFDPSVNFDKPVSFIHVPVPQYQERLESPMARFFNRLEPKDLWQRGNWSVQTNNVLFKLDSHHGREGDETKELSMDEIDFDNACFMRCERQVFTRLPKSRAVIMLVRTYLTPIKQIREEGLGEIMANAIESLPADLAFYKRRQAWGNAVKQYLRMP